MSAVQQEIESQRYQGDLVKERQERQALEARIKSMEIDGRKARYERDLVPLLNVYQFDLVQEVTDMAEYEYDEAKCTKQIERIKARYQKIVTDPGLIEHGDNPNILPARRTHADDLPGKVTYELQRKARKYATDHKVTFDEALEKIRAEAQAS